MPGGSGYQQQGSGFGRFFRGRGRGRGAFLNSVNTTIKRGYWYEVIVVNGARYTREVVLQSLHAFLSPEKFFPICYQVVRSDSAFFVETWAMAQRLLSCTRKITMSDGEPLILRIKENRPPITAIDNVATNKIKEVMARRYVAENKALDLSRFHQDPEFIDGMYCSLSRGPVLQAVLKIITENIPDVVALNLSANSINDLEPAATDFKALKNLRILYLSENQISQLNSINCLKGCEITELTLERNPVAHSMDYATLVRYGQRTGVTDVRKRFPKLTKLDNTTLPAIVSFDVEDEGKLPDPQAAFICAPEGREFVTVFLSQYYQIYDSDNRVELTQAYSENAVFSLNAHNLSGPGANAQPRLNSYFAEARNLLRIAEFGRRRHRLRQGRQEVVNFLYKQLPKTQHDLPSFVVDLPFFMPELIQLVVSGIFRETGVGQPTNWPLRYFSRTFLIVRANGGFCITNDTLFVTNCTPAQKEIAFKVEPEKPVVASPTPVAPSVAASPSGVMLDDSVKLQMVQTVAQQTGMNLAWSRKCLEETEWDFQRAGYTFTELQKRGAIPAEAFIK